MRKRITELLTSIIIVMLSYTITACTLNSLFPPESTYIGDGETEEVIEYPIQEDDDDEPPYNDELPTYSDIHPDESDFEAATAEPRAAKLGTRVQGYDVIGLAKYCNVWLNAPRLPAVSTLQRSFGNVIPCLRKGLDKGFLTDVQIDLRDATCFRNGVCPPGTPELTDWNDMRKMIRNINAKLVTQYPQVTFWISPWLEHDIKNSTTVQRGMDIIRTACPTCRVINSPFTGVSVPNAPLEKHGTKVSAFAVSADGSSTFDGDNIKNDGNHFEHRVAGADQTYAWWNELNGRCTGENFFVPIDRRTAWPELWQFRMAYKIFTTAEDPFPAVPPVCKTVVKINAKQGEINKPTAEKYCNGGKDDGRGNKPLLILRKGGLRGSKLDVYSPTGKKVGCFGYYGPFSEPGLHRWYMGNCSKQQGYKLYRDLGNQEWGYAHLGNGKCLRFNAIRREGKYR